MKKFFFLITIFLSINCVAQRLTAYGVSLGDSKYKVESTLSHKGKTVRSGIIEDDGREYLEISSVVIGGVEFDEAFFRFNQDDKLELIRFNCEADGGTGSPGMPWEARFLNRARRYNQIFQKMYQNLVMKYGNPSSSIAGAVKCEAVWQMGDQLIELEYTYQYERASYGAVDFFTGLSLGYKTMDMNSNDF